MHSPLRSGAAISLAEVRQRATDFGITDVNTLERINALVNCYSQVASSDLNATLIQT